MIKLLAIAASGTLHVSLLAAIATSVGTNLSDGGTFAVHLVADPVAVTPRTAAPDQAIPIGGAPPATQAPVRNTEPPATGSEASAPTQLDTADSVVVHDAATPMHHSLHAQAEPTPRPMLAPAREPAPSRSAVAAPARDVLDQAVMSTAEPAAPVVGPDSPGSADGIPGSGPSTPVALLSSVSPSYPDEARRAGQEGRVVIKAFVDNAGAVAGTEIEISSGFAKLDAAAAAAVSSYRFLPEVRGGVRIASTVLVPIRFSLTDGN